MTSQRPSKGFTLIEIMVVVGILAIVSAVAIPAYLDYVDGANTAKVLSHYEEGSRYLRTEVLKLNAAVVMGEETLESVEANFTSSFWVSKLNRDGGRAPGGGPAYGVSVDHSLGRVGVLAAGSLFDTPPTYRLEVTRPQYGGFAQYSVMTAIIPWSGGSRGVSFGPPAGSTPEPAGGVAGPDPGRGAGGGNDPGQGQGQDRGQSQGQGQGKGKSA